MIPFILRFSEIKKRNIVIVLFGFTSVKLKCTESIAGTGELTEWYSLFCHLIVQGIGMTGNTFNFISFIIS